VVVVGSATLYAVRLVARRREAELARLVTERTLELTRLVDLAEQINRGTRVEDVLDHVYESLRGVIPYDRVGLALLDEGRIVLRALWSRSEARHVEIGKGYEAPIASSSLKEVLEAGRPRILNDLEAYLAAHPDSESTRRIVREGIRSSLTLPLRSEGVPVGAVFFSSFRSGVYDESHARLLAGIAGHLSIVVTKSRLYEDLLLTKARLEAANVELTRLASADPLTGLANRRAFDEALESEWRRAFRSRVPLAVLMVDVDHFKAYNDHFGHAAGDVCLREVARALSSRVRRAGDVVARWGGEEFAAILYDCNAEDARLMAERVRDVVAQRRIPHPGSPTGFLTVSVGGASEVPHAAEDSGALPRKADEALYAAKRTGRNRSEVLGA
jgi:diguanylate cyclase (GGDEF)-like protein